VNLGGLGGLCGTNIFLRSSRIFWFGARCLWPVARGPWPVRLPRRFAPRNDEVEFVQISCKSVSEKILSVFSVAL